MVEKTRSVKKIAINDVAMNNLIFQKRLELFEGVLDKLSTEVENISNTTTPEWIKIQNAPFYYISSENMVVVDPQRERISSEAYISVEPFQMKAMTEDSARKLFADYQNSNPLLNETFSMIYTDNEGNVRNANSIYLGTDKTFAWQSRSMRSWGITDHDSIKLPTYYLTKEEKSNKLLFLLKNNMSIFLDTALNALFLFCCNLYQKGQLMGIEGGVVVNPDFSDEAVFMNFIKQNKMNILGIDFSDASVKKIIQLEDYQEDASTLSDMIDNLLSCDEKRIHMERYPESVLSDPESGHWDLWGDSKSDNWIKLKNGFVARNPIYDALNNRSGVVGIDFGTKSTVVTYRQSTADVLPMRIGSGQYAREVSMQDYENPTAMELRDFESFMTAYNNREGRPLTCWNDLLVSHEAFSQLVEEQRSGDTFASFFSELKQWASDKERQVTLKDAKDKKIDIPPYLNLKEGDFDPIEIYAYYIGLFINNMINKIYLRYKLSFPAKAEKQVRDKVLASFEKGIKKSLPEAVLNDKECMHIFRVEQGASEPAAYAICALQEYGFDPEDDEKIYYGIFDFGGGTTDFDFGTWSSKVDDDNYDYEISRFGEGEDPYLGGENLLGMMAYEVFLDNYEKLRKDNIIFIRPYGAKSEVGRDWLVRQDSQYAHFNSKRLMEKLRGVWENDPEIRKEVDSGTIQISLFDIKGNANSNYSLSVSLEKLDLLIEKRIESGVTQFFSTLKNSFGVSDSLVKIHEIDEMNIFLAGNSCKSHVVLNVFKKQIDELYHDMSSDNIIEKWIRIYPPLGTEQATKIQNGELEPDIDAIIQDINKQMDSSEHESNVENRAKKPNINEKNQNESNHKEQSESDFSNLLEKLKKPNGKTGVAFGLLDNRVRIVQNGEESRFKYYLVQNRKKKFKCVIDKDKQEYGEWKRFCSASVDTFDIWFTRSSEAPSNTMPITEMGIYSETGFIKEPNETANVFIRLISPTDLEYTVSTLSEEQMNQKNHSKDEIKRISLQEKA